MNHDFATDRTGRIVITSTGVRIGCAYTQPAPAASEDSVFVQRLLLDQPAAECEPRCVDPFDRVLAAGHRWVPRACIAIGVPLLVTLISGHMR